MLRNKINKKRDTVKSIKKYSICYSISLSLVINKQMKSIQIQTNDVIHESNMKKVYL